MTNPSALRAIKAALAGNWDEAIEFNLQVLKDEPQNIDALNRLARAYAAVGQTKNAHKTWNKVLHFDRYNTIALHQLNKLKVKTTPSDHLAPTSAQTFLDEPGKTKTVHLTRLANAKVLMGLEPGQPATLSTKKRSLTITTISGEYIGTLPEDLSQHLARLIRSGNRYDALIRRVEKSAIMVFIKETKRSKHHQHTPSFPTNFTRLINLEPLPAITESPLEISPTGEEDSYQ